MTRSILILAVVVTFTAPLFGGEPSPIEDSSFFAESGRNRDDAVVQVNSFFLGRTMAHELTHEWAGSSSKHQFGYTLTLYSDEKSGFGDAMLHYRYQLVGSDASRIGIAPRLSLVLPTRSREFGVASSGLEFVIPLSAKMNDRVETHTNAAVTWFRDREETEYKLTQGVALAVTDRIVFSIEAAYTKCPAPDHLFVVRPGIQFTMATPGGLTVTPGIALPLGTEERGVLLFVALERGVSR